MVPDDIMKERRANERELNDSKSKGTEIKSREKRGGMEDSSACWYVKCAGEMKNDGETEA